MSASIPITRKAEELWTAMSPSQRHGVGFGLFPSAVMDAAQRDGYDGRELALHLMEVARRHGAMRG